MSTMSKPKHLAVALVCALAFTGCDKKGDVISNAAQADPKVGIAAPGIAEIKAIAEEGFIYGLPLVMNYTAIYLVMRLYWPKTEAPSILPPGEGTWKPPGIVQAHDS